MNWFERTFRLAAFLAYTFFLIALPFMVVWGWTGFLLSLPIDFFAVFWLRFRGYSAIGARLKAVPSTWDDRPAVKNAVAEMARRLGIPVPALLVMKRSGAHNLGTLGFHPGCS